MSENVPESLDKRKPARTECLDRLNNLASQDRFLVAGPHPAIDPIEPEEAGFSGSLVIAKFDDLEQAQARADADPYVTAGVYQRVVFKPFKRVL